MVVKTHDAEIFKDAEDSPVYQFARKAGNNIVKRKPIFSPDKKSLLVIVENVVRVYNVQTGEIVRILETEKPCSELIAIQFPENENYNLYACSSDGCIITWTFESGGVVREVELDLQPNEKVFSFDLLQNDEAFITLAKNNDKFYTFISFNIKTGKVAIKYKGYPVLKTSILCVTLGYCDRDRYAAVCNGTKCLIIQNLIQPHLKLQFYNSNNLRIISAAAHPRESSIAITDTLGRVTIVKGYLYDNRNLAREVMHWHYLPVFASCFSKEGTYLYTGGMERVLVKWVGSGAGGTQDKQFIVRLPGHVRHVAVSDALLAISLNNNSLVIASTQMKVQTTIQECGGLSPAARSLGTSLVYHKPTDSLVLGGRTGHLQLYSTASDKLLYNLDITDSNGIPPTRYNLLPLEIEVACVAVSGDGAWLVTSEYRNDQVMYPEERLKFWSLQNTGDSPFKLNTCVNLSHGGCQVVSLALSNKGDFCVSAGKDNKFRIWKLETNGQDIHWCCLTACYYSSGFAQSTAQEILNGFKNNEFNKAGKREELAYMTEDLGDRDVVKNIINISKDSHFVDLQRERFFSKDSAEMGGVSISQDGSLIAAWFGCKLTLWDTHQCALKAGMAHPALRPVGRLVAFGNHDAAHYLVCTTDNCLAVWSLLSLTIKWFVNMRPVCLASDPFTNKMAVITDDNQVFVFTPHSATPLLQRKLLDARGGVFTHCAFAPAARDLVRLYMMRNDCEIYALEPERQYEGQLEAISHRRLPRSNFSALLAEQQRSEVRAERVAALQQLDTEALGKSAMKQFLSSASHMVPPISLISTTFLEHLCGRRLDDNEETNEAGSMKMQVDDEASSDEEEGGVEKVEEKKIELWTANISDVDPSRLRRVGKAAAPEVALQMLFAEPQPKVKRKSNAGLTADEAGA